MTTRATKWLAGAGCAAMACLGAAPALAAGTTAGTNIVNNVFITYSVGGVQQTANAPGSNNPAASNSLIVDRRISMTMSGTPATTTVAPGQTNGAVAYYLSNTSNAAVGFALTATIQSTGAAAHGGTANYSQSTAAQPTPTIWINAANSPSNGTANFDPTNAVQVTTSGLSSLAADANQWIFVVSPTPTNRVNGDVSGMYLQAQAVEPGTTTVIQQTSGARDPSKVNTIFQDSGGGTGNVAGDGVNDGKVSFWNDYTVSAPVLTVTKLSSIIWDPITKSATNSRSIPGSVISYCIVVANASSGAPATNITITDPIPTNATFITSSNVPSGSNVPVGVYLNGSVTTTGGVTSCNSDGTLTSGTFASNTVTGTIASLPAGSSKTLYFTALIN